MNDEQKWKNCALDIIAMVPRARMIHLAPNFVFIEK